MSIEETIRRVLLLSYNTNFFINFGIHLKFLVPYLVCEIFLGIELSLEHFIKILIILIALVILYSIGYIINDTFDAKRNGGTLRRLSLIYYCPDLEIRHYLPFYLAEVAAAFIMLRLVGDDIARVGILLYTNIIALSIIHTVFFKAKVVTSFLLRLSRMIGLGSFISLLDFPSSNLIPRDLMTVFILVLFPAYNFRGYMDYLEYKNLNDARLYGILLHASYYVTILTYLYHSSRLQEGYLNSITLLTFVFVCYVAILKCASKSMKTLMKKTPINSLLRGLYSSEEGAREFSEILLNLLIFLLLFILP